MHTASSLAPTGSMLRVHIVPPGGPRRRTMLPQLVDQLDTLARFLRTFAEKKKDSTIEVTGLELKNGLSVLLRPLEIPVHEVEAAEPTHRKYKVYASITNKATRTLTALVDDRPLPSYVDDYVLMHLKEFADDVIRSGHVAQVVSKDGVFAIDEKLKKQIDAKIGRTWQAHTTITGTLLRLNTAGRRWSFTIFPPVGQRRVVCSFEESLLDQVKGLYGTDCSVTGLATYATGRPPAKMIAKEIRGHGGTSERSPLAIVEALALAVAESDETDVAISEMRASWLG